MEMQLSPFHRHSRCLPPSYDRRPWASAERSMQDMKQQGPSDSPEQDISCCYPTNGITVTMEMLTSTTSQHRHGTLGYKSRSLGSMLTVDHSTVNLRRTLQILNVHLLVPRMARPAGVDAACDLSDVSCCSRAPGAAVRTAARTGKQTDAPCVNLTAAESGYLSICPSVWLSKSAASLDGLDTSGPMWSVDRHGHFVLSSNLNISADIL